MMPIQNLFVRTRRSIQGIQLDAVISESHDNVVRITKNPVEFGADVSDHAVIEPKKVTILAEVTDSPMGFASLGQIVDPVTGLFGSATLGSVTRSSAAYNAMIKLQELREPIDVQTRLRLYRNMMIIGISTSQDKETSRIVSMNISLEEVLITESETVKLDPSQLIGTTKQQGSSADKKGRKEPVTPDDATKRSALKFLTDKLGAT